MLFTYRALTTEDLDAVCSFPLNAEELFYFIPRASYPLTPEQVWSKALERHLPTVVCERETKEIAAYANLYDWNETEAACWLGNVIVSPPFRGKGAAAFLLRSMMDQAAEKLGVRTLKLYCHNPNTRALLFYLKQGFVPNGGYKIFDHPNGHKIAGLEMEKRLS
ncbi:GNAT family N-acetyltransferase [Cohnella caldifontis]|uniref:GNAT family N-acetyltransferase n=1 Tax=Cohnella caldifontis TaxID=3027471 RepID=UPI0023EDA397|nr:GNAT family N-acetyltransferase [Cohnella sp. YIM B05605]